MRNYAWCIKPRGQPFARDNYDYYEVFFIFYFILYTLLIPFGKFVFVTQRNCVATEQRH